MDTASKAFEVTWEGKASGSAPEAGDLAAINRHALEPLAADQVYVRTIALCNDRYDRAGERFPVGYLDRFAASLPGKSLLAGHNKRSLPLGKFFSAHVAPQGGGGHALLTSFYMRRSPENEALRADIDAGVVSHASVGFRWSDLVCDLCQRSYYQGTRDENGDVRYCPHVIGRVYNGQECTATYGGDLAKVEAVEGSLVYLGCQYDSEVVKALGDAAEREALRARMREGWMAEERAGVDLSARVAALELELGEAATGRNAAAARVVELEASVAETAGFVADGRLYRVDLAAEVKRLAGLVGASSEAALVLKACETADAAALKAVVAEYAARFEKAFPPSGKGVPAQPADGAREVSARAPRRFALW